MGRELARLAVAAIGALVVAGCAADTQSVGAIEVLPHAFAALKTLPPTASALPDSLTATDIPPGFIGFCVRFPDQCSAEHSSSKPIPLNDAAWQTIQQVNLAVNMAIRPMDDMRHYGVAEYWTIVSDGYGDCEDYALTKRKKLIEMGYDGQMLRIAIVKTPQEARHAVLTVVTDKGDYVLDNLRYDVVSWTATGYSWIARQNPAQPLGWVSLQSPEMAAADANPTARELSVVSSIK